MSLRLRSWNILNSRLGGPVFSSYPVWKNLFVLKMKTSSKIPQQFTYQTITLPTCCQQVDTFPICSVVALQILFTFFILNIIPSSDRCVTRSPWSMDTLLRIMLLSHALSSCNISWATTIPWTMLVLITTGIITGFIAFLIWGSRSSIDRGCCGQHRWALSSSCSNFRTFLLCTYTTVLGYQICKIRNDSIGSIVASWNIFLIRHLIHLKIWTFSLLTLHC